MNYNYKINKYKKMINKYFKKQKLLIIKMIFKNK